MKFYRQSSVIAAYIIYLSAHMIVTLTNRLSAHGIFIYHL